MHRESIDNFEEGIRYATFGRWILKSLGIWPETEESEMRKCFSNLLIVIGNLILSFAIIPCFLYVILEERDLNIKLKLFGLVSFASSATLKYCFLFLHQSEIAECIKYLKHDWHQVKHRAHRELMLRYAKIARKLTILCAIFMYTGGIVFHTILPFSAPRIVDQNNRTLKPVVYPSYSVLYNVQMSPTYEFVYLLHCMCGYVIYSVTVGACNLAAVFTMHVCGQIEIIASFMDDLVEGKKFDAGRPCASQRLTAIIKHHLRVLRLATIIRSLLQEVCLIEFLGSVSIICLLEYYCITDWEESNGISLSTYATLLISLSFNIFILCYLGECLMNKTSQVGAKVFTINWYCLPPEAARALVLIIAVSHKPVKITAGRLIDLSLFTFGNILKTTLVYLNFLRTLVV
ncbi:hypothetical protein KPH14_009227 [Odynerus spinipes]|uniref:Odorant receptor n=1 Tax=Odynerus spinipes TaxID=1348599 RepID=A0AAD9RNX2_9HYME|nr:hypothetical protein KPH14_009227 [Odynerus spinipes]